MKPLQRLSVIEQSAEHIRELIRKQEWTGKLPGVVKLAEKLGVSKLTMRAALRVLEDEGIISLAENGYSRHVVSDTDPGEKIFRVAILIQEPLIDQIAQMQQLILKTQEELEQYGFVTILDDQSLDATQTDTHRLITLKDNLLADAYIFIAINAEITEWFLAQEIPCLAVFGRGEKSPIARVGSDKAQAMKDVVEHLVEYDHRRIVLLNRKDRRLPTMGRTERAFFNALADNGIQTGSYNMPDWEESPEGLHQMLSELFRVTPPTAIITDEVKVFCAVQQFLAERRILVPDQVSMVACDEDSCFSWCNRPVSHVRWENEPIVQRIIKWANTVKLGRKDCEKKYFPAEYVKGGTVGPARV